MIRLEHVPGIVILIMLALCVVSGALGNP